MAIRTANNQSLTEITELPSAVTTGSLVLLETQTESDSSGISFTDNIDSTYDEYIFKFIDIHNDTNNGGFSFQVDTGTNTDYNQTITSATFKSEHNEGDTGTALEYRTDFDQAQGTAFQRLVEGTGDGADESAAGTLHLFNPSSGTFVKHFYSTCNGYQGDDYNECIFAAGYVNTTTALTRVQFKAISGTFDGTIKMYGVT